MKRLILALITYLALTTACSAATPSAAPPNEANIEASADASGTPEDPSSAATPGLTATTSTPEPASTQAPASASVPSQAPATTALPPFITLEHDDLSPLQMTTVVEGLLSGIEYAATLSLPEPTQVHIAAFADFDDLVESYATAINSTESAAALHWGNGSSGAIAIPGRLFVNFSPDWWGTLDDPVARKIVAHEYFHTIQHAISRASLGASPEQVPAAGPVWLNEGAAELFGYLALDHRETLPWSEARATLVGRSGHTSQSLAELDRWSGMSEAPTGYELAALAAEYATGGDATLMQEYYAARDERPWEDTFRDTFGVSVDVFYRSFEEYRANGFK